MKGIYKQINKLYILIILSATIIISCEEKSNEVSTPKADFLNETGPGEKGIIIENSIVLNGLYRVIPEDKSLDVDITVDFKVDNNSDWKTKIGEHISEVPKKYKIFADALYITHNLKEFETVITELKKKGKKETANMMESMINTIPETDKYRIETSDNDTIKLFGSRINYSLVKIE